MASQLDQVLSYIQGAPARVSAIASQRDAATAPLRQDITQTTNAPLPQRPQQAALPEMPSPVDPRQFQQFTGTALLFAALAGGLTRAPLTTALNSFSAGIQGFYKGSQDNYTQNLEKWKAETERALQTNKTQLDQYRAILDDRKLTLAEKTTQLKLMSAQFDDQMAAEESRDRGAEGLARLLIERDKASQQVEMQFNKLYGQTAKSRKVDRTTWQQAYQKINNHPSLSQLPAQAKQDLAFEIGAKAIDMQLANKNMDLSTAMAAVEEQIVNDPARFQAGSQGVGFSVGGHDFHIPFGGHTPATLTPEPGSAGAVTPPAAPSISPQQREEWIQKQMKAGWKREDAVREGVKLGILPPISGVSDTEQPGVGSVTLTKQLRRQFDDYLVETQSSGEKAKLWEEWLKDRGYRLDQRDLVIPPSGTNG